jgi:predicted ATP-binding protein involved in virulence
MEPEERSTEVSGETDIGFYFLSLQVENVRCFLEKQTLDLRAANGRPARWTLLLGENGVGKTTMLQALVLAAPEPRSPSPIRRSGEPPSVLMPPRAFEALQTFTPLLLRGESNAEMTAEVSWTSSLTTLTVLDTMSFSGTAGGASANLYSHYPQKEPDRTPSRPFVCAYGANRRRAPPGLTSEASTDATRTLFDDDAFLRNPEEWFLQNELLASMAPSPAQQTALRRRERVKEILTRVLPEITDIRTSARTEKGETRATVEVKGPDGWVPISKLGLGYRTMTAWMVDFASRLFERYPDLPDPLAGPAVCLVDEIDLHLHPRWQRQLIQHLTAIFPETQFIATAHSPLVVQAAPGDANLVLLRRRGDRVSIERAPDAVRKWRLDQILTSELFDLPSARAPELDTLLEERDAILGKATVTENDQKRLEELSKRIGEPTYGETPEDIEAMNVIRRAAKTLKDGGQ